MALADLVKKFLRRWQLKVNTICVTIATRLEDGAGAHITIFARRQRSLGEAENEILAARQNANQMVNAVSLDLGDSSEVRSNF